MERNIKNSQNFLHNKELVSSLVSKSNLSKDDLIIEIGPGKGIITDAIRNHSNHIRAIEYDHSLAERLINSYKDTDQVTIIEEDFLNYPLPQKPYKVFSNIPFNMTAEILTKLLTAENIPNDMYLIMQYEAVLKYAGNPYYSESYRSLLFKPFVEISIIHTFDATDFYPVPSVKIVFAHFHKREFSDIKNASKSEYWDFISSVFADSGKSFKEKTKHIFSYEQQKRLKKHLKINDEDSISTWSYRQWLGMFDCYIKLVDKEKKQKVNGAYNRYQKNQLKLTKIHRTRTKKQ